MARDDLQDQLEAEHRAEAERELLHTAAQELKMVLDQLEIYFDKEQREENRSQAGHSRGRHTRETDTHAEALSRAEHGWRAWRDLDRADMARTSFYELPTCQTYQVSLLDFLGDLSTQVDKLKRLPSLANYINFVCTRMAPLGETGIC